MNKYRAIVSIEFDDDDLTALADNLDIEEIDDPIESINAELSCLTFGVSWVEQFFCNGKPQIGRLSDGISVEINEHDL